MKIHETALTKYISSTLHTIVEKFDTHCDHINTFCNIYDFKNPVFKEKNNIEEIFRYSDKQCPAIICINNELVYTLITTSKYRRYFKHKC